MTDINEFSDRSESSFLSAMKQQLVLDQVLPAHVEVYIYKLCQLYLKYP